MTTFWLLIFVVIVVETTADISRINPPVGSCVCASSSGINVHNSVCGKVIGQIRRGQCFISRGQKSSCILRGQRYQFFELRYNYGSGWVSGHNLVIGSPSKCRQLSSSVTGVCPRIVTRSRWGARRPSRSTNHIRHEVSKVFIHHTESTSCGTQSDCSRRVREIQNHQMDKKEMSDIGYNFLVGEDGNVYEGRGWNLVGGHASNWNSVAIGIAVIGNFQNSVPNGTAQNAIKQLIACGVKMGKISKSYSLHGHRDGVCTDCPGDALYNLIKTWTSYGGRLRGACAQFVNTANNASTIITNTSSVVA